MYTRLTHMTALVQIKMINCKTNGINYYQRKQQITRDMINAMLIS